MFQTLPLPRLAQPMAEQAWRGVGIGGDVLIIISEIEVEKRLEMSKMRLLRIRPAKQRDMTSYPAGTFQ